MEKLYIKLEQMRERPGMYLGAKSFSRLISFINGYQTCEREYGKEYSSFDKFTDFTRKYYNVDPRNTTGWTHLITDHSTTDEDAVDLFYSLLDIFVKDDTPYLTSKEVAENINKLAMEIFKSK